MSETVLLGLIAAGGGAGFTTIITTLLNRRNANANADVTVSGAWQNYAADLKAELDSLKGEFRAAQQAIAVLERKRDEALFWQAQVTAREEIVTGLLQERGVPVPPMPTPPILREPYTRATDRED